MRGARRDPRPGGLAGVVESLVVLRDNAGPRCGGHENSAIAWERWSVDVVSMKGETMEREKVPPASDEAGLHPVCRICETRPSPITTSSQSKWRNERVGPPCASCRRMLRGERRIWVRDPSIRFRGGRLRTERLCVCGEWVEKGSNALKTTLRAKGTAPDAPVGSPSGACGFGAGANGGSAANASPRQERPRNVGGGWTPTCSVPMQAMPGGGCQWRKRPRASWASADGGGAALSPRR